MEFDEFVKDKADCYSIDSGLAVWKVKNSEFLRNLEMPEIHIQMFIIRGRINAVIDNNNVILESESIIDILHSPSYINNASDNISVIFIFTTEAFLSNLIKNKPPFPIEYVMQKFEQPMLLLTHGQSVVIQERLTLLLSLFKGEHHYYLSEMVKCALWMVFLEMANIYRQQNEDINSSSETDRKRMLFMQFVKMIPMHVRQERSIGFYASELNVSCQYLERIVKSISGQTAYQWVQRTLIGEVNHQLKDTDDTMQQIADDFGFPDQASFTKYYKRNVHITPTDFRKKNIV